MKYTEIDFEKDYKQYPERFFDLERNEMSLFIANNPKFDYLSLLLEDRRTNLNQIEYLESEISE